MKKVIRLTESDLARIVKRVLMEQGIPTEVPGLPTEINTCLKEKGVTTELPKACLDAINKIMKMPGGEIPEITDPIFFQCGSELGFKAFSVGPKIIECLTQIKPDNSENLTNP